LRATAPAGLDHKESEIWAGLDPRELPRHIAIIMDGNGRWAKRRHLPRIAGHRAGVASVRSTVETAARIGIPALTLYAFSVENWQKRPRTEVEFLMRLLRHYLKSELPTLMKNNIRLEYIGRERELAPSVRARMAQAREETSRNSGMVLTLALNYGARSELVIRTSGEMRLSNFLLWQVAYAEIFVTETLWPDFRGRHLLEAIGEYQKRERRFGGVSAHSNGNSR
jgi:undecaprenyl diphosphate synthase